MPTSMILEDPPRNDDELWWTVRVLWGVTIPRTKVCEEHCAPFDAFADAYFARSSVALWLGSRGFGGKTMSLSILGMTELVNLGAFVTILGGSGAQSQRVHETMTEAWHYEESPSYLLAKDPTKYETYLKNGAKAKTLMASSKSVRGPHPQRLRMDEVDEMEINILTSAQGQPMRKKNLAGEVIETNTVFSSTHQYPDGTVTYLLNEAEERGWPKYRWCYRESANPKDGWLSMDEVERKKKEVPAEMFRAEYDMQEPSFEGRAIDEDAVDAMFDPSLGVYDGKDMKYIRTSLPRADRDYVTGADWAKAQDYTVICTWDSTVYPWKLVAFEMMRRKAWPVMVGRLNERWKMYGGKVVHDATGIGGVISDYIEFPKSTRKSDLIGITMAGQIRTSMITEYVNAVEKRQLIAPRIKSMYDEHRFVTADDLYNGSSSSHLPDTIAASALAWTARNRYMQKASNIISLTRDEPSPWAAQEMPAATQWLTGSTGTPVDNNGYPILGGGSKWLQ